MKKVFLGLIVLLLLGSCSDLFIHGSFETDADITVPEGFAALKITLDQGPARTVMPLAGISSFHHFEYLFSRNGGTPAVMEPQGSLFIVEPGSYQLTVNAYTKADSGSLAAQGSSTFSITSGQSPANVSVTMHPFVSGEGKGTLEFSMKYPTGVTIDKYTLTSIAGGEAYSLLASSTATGSNPVTRSGTISVPVGYYHLEVKLTNAVGDYAGKIEVVHIYRNMVSVTKLDDYTFTTSDFVPSAPPQTPIITIITQPAANTTVTFGSISGSLSVSAAVTQGATLSYQWYSNTSAVNSGGTPVAGSGTGASFVIPTSLTAGKYYYYVVVSATGGAASVASTAATVIVNGKYLIALTFDDGPNANNNCTTGVLDMLDKYGAKGTFFINGRNFNSRTTPFLQRMVRDGHLIANHSQNHIDFVYDKPKLTRAQIIEEINNTSTAIFNVVGVLPKFFRAPYFSIDSTMVGIDQETTPPMPWISCGIDTNDWETGKSAQAIANEVLNKAKSRTGNSGADGAIVLEHDGITDRSPYTVQALDIFLPQMKEWGYEFVTLSEIYERKGVTPAKLTANNNWPNNWVGKEP